jgi:hypothetical protein
MTTGYVPAVDEVFPTEAEAIEAAATRGAERVETERGRLLRPAGTPSYVPAEQAERERAIFDGVAAQYDQATQRYLTQADADPGRR